MCIRDSSYTLDYRTGGPPYYPGNGSAAYNNGMAGKLLTNSFASNPQLVVTQTGDCLLYTSTTPGNCSVDNKENSSPYTDYSTCTYNASGSVANNQTACTANDQTGASSMTGNKVTCEYEATADTPTSVGTCTACLLYTSRCV